MSIKMTHLFGDRNGITHLEQMELPTREQPSLPGLAQLEIPTTSMIYTEHLRRRPLTRHCAPRRQFVVCLSGGFEIRSTDGDSAQFGIGDWLFADDLESDGHTTESIGDGPRIGLSIGLPNEWSW